MATDTMNAVVLVDEGEPEASLELQQVPIPEPGPGEVRVALTAASLNHLDIWIRKGLPSVPKPRIMGADGAGRIDTFGDGAEPELRERGISSGSRVLLDPGASCGECAACAVGETSLCSKFRVLGEHVDGTHAGYVVVPAGAVHAIPQHLDDVHAAALTLVFGTAWRMLFSRARVQRGEWVLVWGASSGVGAAALQILTAFGCETIATTRSEDKADELRELGATHVVVTGSGEDAGDRVASAVRDLVGRDGIDVAFDHLGQIAWGPSMSLLRRGGRYVTCGATTGANPPAQITRIFWKQLDILGSTMASRGDIADMIAFVAEHRITPRVDATFPLTDVVAAHRHLESAAQVGKVVLTI